LGVPAWSSWRCSSWWASPGRCSPPSDRAARSVRVATGGGTISAAGITANGYVVARTKASVSAKVFGRLAYLGVARARW